VKRKLGIFFLTILLLLLGMRVVPYLIYHETPPDITALQLLAPPLSHDPVFDQLSLLAQPGFETDIKSPVWALSDGELQSFLETNTPVRDAFERWQQSGGDPITTDEWGLHSRIPWSNADAFPDYRALKLLHHLFMAQACVSIKTGDTQKVQQALRNSLMLAEFCGRNPSLPSLMVSCRMLNEISVLITRFVPDTCLDETLLAALPGQDQLRTRLEQALWTETLRTADQIKKTNKAVEPSQKLAYFLLGPWLFNEGHTMQMLYDLFQWEQAQTRGPLAEREPYPIDIAEDTWRTFNPIGKLMVSIGAPMYRNFYLAVGFAAASVDIARENISARLAGRSFDPHTLQQQSNPLWNKPYVINDQAQIEILPPTDDRWQALHPVGENMADVAGPAAGFERKETDATEEPQEK